MVLSIYYETKNEDRRKRVEFFFINISNVIADILFHSLKTISVWFASNDDSLFGAFKLMSNNL